MKRLIILGVIAIPYFLCGMDVSDDTKMVVRNDYFRPIKLDVFKRHNVSDWHREFTKAILWDNSIKISQMLVKAGKDATELICTAQPTYGSILKMIYMEEKTQVKKLLRHYMDDEYLKKCFELEKAELHDTWNTEWYVNCISPAAERIVRDFYKEDPIKYPLSPEECRKLGIQ